MTELIIKNDMGKKKLEGLLLFLKSWDIDVQVRHMSRKYKVINKSCGLSDEQLSEKLPDKAVDISPCQESDCNEIVKNHRPVFSSGLDKWL